MSSTSSTAITPSSTAKDVLIGIDVGTSSTKVAAFTRDAAVLADQTRDYRLVVDAPGFVEQDPNEWWEAITLATRAVVETVGAHRVAGVGVSGQSWSAVPVDADGTVLANTPIWMDTRSQNICDDLVARVGADRILAVSGNRLAPTYTTGKIIWFQRNRPEVYRAARWFLQSSSFIVLRLTGRVSQDVSQSYGIHAWDTATGEYDQTLAAELSLDLTRLPQAVPCHEVVGTVTAEASAATGLAAGTPVVAEGLDAACGTLGAGVMRVGQTQEQGGQAGGMSIVTDSPVRDERLILSRHVVPGTWLFQGGSIAGGASLNWARNTFGGPQDTFKKIDTDAEGVPVGSDGVWFLPYLQGERGPIWDSDAQGLLFGLGFGTTKAAIWRAVMEGVAFSLLDNVTVAEEAGAETGVLYSVGGAAGSHLWTQIKADVLGKEIRVPAASTASCLGAAVLAGVGTGLYESFDDAARYLGRVERRHTPNPANTARYRELFRIYRELYTSLAPTMHRAADLKRA